MRRTLPLVVITIVGVIVLNLFLISNYKTPEPTIIRGSQETPSLPQEISEMKDELLLPDMQIAPPKQLYIVVEGGVKKIRFNTTFSNIGTGPLELVGENDPARGVTVAKQRIKKTDGGVEELVIGEFVYHPGHKHWHVDRYANFQLYKYDPSRGPGELVASTDKYSFCIWDEHTYDLELPNASQKRVYSRCITNIQGNSVGWGDTYTSNLEGQEVDITGVPDGLYMVRAEVNADYTLIESNYLNNQAILYIEIAGNSLKVEASN